MAKRKKKADEPTSWIVTMKCEVTREVICDECTEQEATDDTFAHSISERDLELTNWEVLEVEPNI